ncbi:MAG: hypothetical protein JO149_09650 [Gammaproteobacteria bacterium]|nr:hypothetical protein [Gammaproteobacteria bacterium]
MSIEDQAKSKVRYARPTERLLTAEILPNQVIVPEKTLLCITEHDEYNDSIHEIIENLKTHKKRDWMTQHAYFCLPLTMGNQYGFVIKSYYDFEICWNGGDNPTDLQIKLADNYDANGKQIIASHFGLGIVTIQNRFSLRTSEMMNLLVMNPPNYFIDGLQSLTAVVETDNLRRDFTFNLKTTRINQWIQIKKGQPLAAVLPYPRRFIDEFEMKLAHEVIDRKIIEEERRTIQYFARERTEVDAKYPGGNGFRYLDGEDIYGIKFKDHQKKVGEKNEKE